MPNRYRQFSRAPAGTKYIVESCGPFIRRYVEFPSGRKVQLPKRKAPFCRDAESHQIGIAPKLANIEAHNRSSRTHEPA